jgi:hypothetical protein
MGQIEAETRSTGLVPRGAFRPGPEDGVPDLAPGRPAATVVMVGNVGPAMWQAFCAGRDPAHDRLDDWTRDVVTALADRLGAAAHFPFSRPYLPFQRWAMRAESCWSSPLGIVIHPEHGLWHAYRAALVFAEGLDLPPAEPRTNPCDSCDDKPCLQSCPVAAFDGDGYDVPACIGHIRTAAGRDCMETGCRARRACPVGHDSRYVPAQAAFHMRAFLRRRLREMPS